MIRVLHLTKHFGGFPAVRDVSFSVREGEVFAFLGPNGSGKTTTMKLMVGLTIPSSGQILINGLDILTHPKETRSQVSFLPQRVVFPELQTAREILRFYCRLRNLPLKRAEHVLGVAGLDEVSMREVREFSGGMVQRLALGVAILPDSPILILDEPTANLDPEGVKHFREFVLRQKEAGKTVLFSTHLLAEAEQLADRVGIFVDGRLVAEDSVETLRKAYLASSSLEDMYLHYVGGADRA
jgi:ABC-type multidrug transport system ATPase subunit